MFSRAPQFARVGLWCVLVFAASASAQDLSAKLIASALEQTTVTVLYDPSYQRLAYPGGDVPMDRGVCSDVIIRAFRSAGLDLQKAVHEDMKKAFPAYPRHWGLSRPDPNIDHRRVYNLMTYFTRQKKALPAPFNGPYLPGDIITWRLENGRPHIGLVSDRSGVSGKAMVIHNIGAGARLEDVLHDWPIIGHFRWAGLEIPNPQR